MENLEDVNAGGPVEGDEDADEIFETSDNDGLDNMVACFKTNKASFEAAKNESTIVCKLKVHKRKRSFDITSIRKRIKVCIVLFGPPDSGVNTTVQHLKEQAIQNYPGMDANLRAALEIERWNRSGTIKTIFLPWKEDLFVSLLICESDNPGAMASALLEADGSILAVHGSAPAFRGHFLDLRQYLLVMKASNLPLDLLSLSDPWDQQYGEDHEIGARIKSYLAKLNHLGPAWSGRMSEDLALGCDVLFSMDPLIFNKEKQAKTSVADKIVIVFSVSKEERMISGRIFSGTIGLGDQLIFMPGSTPVTVRAIMGYGRQLEFAGPRDDISLFINENLGLQDIQYVCGLRSSTLFMTGHIFHAKIHLLSHKNTVKFFQRANLHINFFERSVRIMDIATDQGKFELKVGGTAWVGIYVYGDLCLKRFKDCPKFGKFILEYEPDRLIASGEASFMNA